MNRFRPPRAAWITVVVLGASAACSKPSRDRTSVPDNLAVFLPADATAVFSVDLARLRQTQAWAPLSRLAGDAVAAHLGRTGIRLDDLDLVVAAGAGPSLLFAASGRFAPAAIETALEREKASRDIFHGAQLWTMGENALAAVDGNRIVAGPAASVRQSLENTRSGGLPPALTAAAAAIPAGMPVWGAVSAGFRVSFPDRTNWRNLNRILGALQSGGIWADFDNGVEVQLRGECATAEGAAKLHRQLMGLSAVARLAAPERSDLWQAVDQIGVEQAGRLLTVQLSLPPQAFDLGVPGGGRP
ncbi:MAG: hypothetical protein R2729_11990 [Bryobacteraceae bacterium]